MQNDPLLQVDHLQVSFRKGTEYDPVIHDFSFELHQNEILGIVGESGSGKSVSSLSLMGLLPRQISKIDSGTVIFEGREINLNDTDMLRSMRGRELSMIFQEPMSSLNPSMTCGKQVSEILLNHKLASKKEVKSIVVELFEQVKLPDPELVYSKYPHEISGGQKQRVMIAMAIACKPKVMICWAM